jgi:hypothetical protein
MNHIHNKTEKGNTTARNSNTEKMTIIPTTAPPKESGDSQIPIISNKKKPRKKTTRSGNAFIRPPRQNLLIIKYSEPIVLRFD